MSKIASSFARAIQDRDPIALREFQRLDESGTIEAREFLYSVVQAGRLLDNIRSIHSRINVMQQAFSDMSPEQRRAFFEKIKPGSGLGHQVGSGKVGEHVGREVLSPAAEHIKKNLIETARSKEDLTVRAHAWNDPRWQAHLAGKTDKAVKELLDKKTGAVTRAAHSPWLPLGYARGTESKTADGDGPGGKVPGTIKFRSSPSAKGDWTQSELQDEAHSHLYAAWLQHRGRMVDQGALDARVREVDSVGLKANDPLVIEGGKHAMRAAEMFSEMTKAEQDAVMKIANTLGVTKEQIKENYQKWFKMAVLDKEGRRVGEHWYEGALAFLGGISEMKGVPLQVVGGIAAAHSPQTSWPRNRELTVRSIDLWQENPIIHVTQSTIDKERARIQKTQDNWTQELKTRSAKEASLTEKHLKKHADTKDLVLPAYTQTYLKAQAKLLDPLPPSLQEGDYRVQSLPTMITAKSISLGTTTNNAQRALEIMRTGNPMVLQGRPKISSFYNNQVAPHSSRSGTVDIWAVRIAVDGLKLNMGDSIRPMYWGGEEGKILSGVLSDTAYAQGLMPLIRQVMHEEAAKNNMPESSYQAITWVAMNNYFTGKGGVASGLGGQGHEAEYKSHFKSAEDYKHARKTDQSVVSGD